MKIPEIEWEIIETMSEEIKKSKKNPKAIINIVSEFNLEQPTLAFFIGGIVDGLSQCGKGNALLTCVAIVYKTIKNAIESSSLDEQFKKDNNSK